MLLLVRHLLLLAWHLLLVKIMFFVSFFLVDGFSNFCTTNATRGENLCAALHRRMLNEFAWLVSNKKLLVTKGIASRSKKLLVAPGLTTSNKRLLVTKVGGHRY